MPWNFSRVNLCRPIADGVHRVDEPRPAGVGLLMWFSSNSTAAQLLSEFSCEFASGVDVDRLINRLGARAHFRRGWEVLDQSVTDLLRRPSFRQFPLDVGTKLGIGDQLRLPRPGPMLD
jgi:hypothetical protein